MSEYDNDFLSGTGKIKYEMQTTLIGAYHKMKGMEAALLLDFGDQDV